MSRVKTKETENNEPILENKIPIGVLFDAMNYYSEDDLDKFISSLSHEQAFYCLVEACKSAYKRNAFNLVESEVISRALRIMSKDIS